MKIVISANSAWNIFNFRLDLIKSLIKSNFKIILLTPYEEKYCKILIHLGCEHHHILIDRKSLSPLNNIFLIFQYIKIIKKLNPDFFLGFTIKPNICGSIAANFNGVPVINNISGLGTTFLRSGLLQFFIENIYKIALKKSKKVFFQNPDDRNLFIKKRITSLKKTEVINGSGIDLNHYIFTPNKNYNKNLTKFIYAGRLLWDKGLKELISAIKIVRIKHPSVKLVIVGIIDKNNYSYISMKNIKEWIVDGTIEFFNQTDDIRDYIIKSDCAILPSYREGLPRFLLEAAAIGRPIICTDVPGCRQVVKNNHNGLLCLPKNTYSLSDAIEKFLNLSYEEIKMMENNSRKIAEKYFDHTKVNDLYIKTIKSIN